MQGLSVTLVEPRTGVPAIRMSIMSMSSFRGFRRLLALIRAQARVRSTFSRCKMSSISCPVRPGGRIQLRATYKPGACSLTSLDVMSISISPASVIAGVAGGVETDLAWANIWACCRSPSSGEPLSHRPRGSRLLHHPRGSRFLHHSHLIEWRRFRLSVPGLKA